jgi:YHS domain-containing protein
MDVLPMGRGARPFTKGSPFAVRLGGCGHAVSYEAIGAMMRQIRKQILTIGLVILGLAAVLPVQAASVVTAIVTNPLTGVALDGFDPVSYFTENEPLLGSAGQAYDWGGVTWYFSSAANRDAFIKAPDVYAPQFGGHGTMSLARGFLSDGNARVYLILGERLYLFYSGANRDAFMMAPQKALEDAMKNWPALAATLSTQ